jgi:hypothetical protein
MSSILDWFHDLWRRRFGRYTLDDPRPIAREAPYTFHLPSEAELNALKSGDHVKLMFNGHPPGRQWAVERMWVEIVEISASGLVGMLDNDPFDMPQLRHGDRVAFQSYHTIDIGWADPAVGEAFATPEKQIWERCFVDKHVLDGDARVGYVYRETPDMTEEGDKFPDSGWRIRADETGLPEGEIEARGATYVAIGAVLNKDDSWLHLLSEPTGSAFIRDAETGLFTPTEPRAEEEGADI